MSSVDTKEGCTPSPPMRPTESVRLELTKMSVEAGISWTQIVRQACESTSNVLNIARVGVWIMVNDRQTLQCFRLFEREKKSWTEGALLQVADFQSISIISTVAKWFQRKPR